MGLNIFFKEDICNALSAAYLASSAATMERAGMANESYRRGFMDALSTIALAFGLSPQDFRKENNNELLDG